MAGKLTILLVAALAASLVVANASIYRLNVDLDGDENQERPQTRCDEEFRRHQHFRSCQNYMRQQVRRGGGYADEEEGLINQQSSMQECCNQLRQVSRDCVCPVMREAVEWQERQLVEEQQREGQPRHQEIRQLFRFGSNIPMECGVVQQRCPFGTRTVM